MLKQCDEVKIVVWLFEKLDFDFQKRIQIFSWKFKNFSTRNGKETVSWKLCKADNSSHTIM